MTGNNIPSPDERVRAHNALELRLSGRRWTDIAESLGYADESGPRKAVERLLDRTGAELVGEYRAQELARLDRVHETYWPAALAGDTDAAGLVLKTHDRRVKLLGLAPAERHQLTHRLDGITADEFVSEAVKLLDELGGDLPPLGSAEPWVLDDEPPALTTTTDHEEP